MLRFAIVVMLATCGTWVHAASVTPLESEDSVLLDPDTLEVFETDEKVGITEFSTMFRGSKPVTDPGAAIDLKTDPLRGIRPDSEWKRPPESSLLR